MGKYLDYEAINKISFTDTVLLDGKVRTERIVLVRDIKKLPAADVVPVVRCKDCICYTPVDENTGKCVFFIGKHQYVAPDGYCYLGERKEGAE